MTWPSDDQSDARLHVAHRLNCESLAFVANYTRKINNVVAVVTTEEVLSMGKRRIKHVGCDSIKVIKTIRYHPGISEYLLTFG
jgi:hypothetical protein